METLSHEDANADTPAPAFKYDAFASYATDPDRDLVRDVEQYLEGLHKVWLLPKEFSKPVAVCVDGSDFASRANQNTTQTLKKQLSQDIRAHQVQSRCLLVFFGEKTANHPWVNEEIEWWLQQKPPRPMYFILTHGQLDEDPNGRVTIPPEAIPTALRNIHPSVSESLWFDLRGYYLKRKRGRPLTTESEVRQQAHTWIRVRDYEAERDRLAAQIVAHRMGPISPEDVIPKWLRIFRAKRLIWRNLILIATIVFAILGVSLDRWIQYRRVAALTGDVQSAVDDQQHEKAMLLALSGLPVAYDFSWWRPGWSDPEVRGLLAKLAGAAQLSAYVGQLLPKGDKPIQVAAFDPSGSRIVTASQAGFIELWTAKRSNQLPPVTKLMHLQGLLPQGSLRSGSGIPASAKIKTRS
jgi:MTH538 TIR-like domain (DUF1863)